ncbi:MAG: hypothetical protein KC519_10215 [Anaerolineae bacterium]|nr:hypothetical protein [Anaerolineae bacterium]
MKITFERSGGFVGRRLAGIIETDILAPDEAAEVAQLVEDANFFKLPRSLRPRLAIADDYEYVVTIVADEHEHTVETTDHSAPETLRPLLWRLAEIVHASRRDDGEG